jgi:hypothetical protein
MMRMTRTEKKVQFFNHFFQNGLTPAFYRDNPPPAVDGDADGDTGGQQQQRQQMAHHHLVPLVPPRAAKNGFLAGVQNAKGSKNGGGGGGHQLSTSSSMSLDDGTNTGSSGTFDHGWY